MKLYISRYISGRDQSLQGKRNWFSIWRFNVILWRHTPGHTGFRSIGACFILSFVTANICPMVWYLKSYKSSYCVPISGLTSFHSTAKIAPRMHQRSFFWAQKSKKNFWGGSWRGRSPLPRPLAQWGVGTPSPHTLPTSAPLAPGSSRYGAQNSVPRLFPFHPRILGC